MTQDLFKIRRSLTQVPSHLKQGNLLSAVHATIAALKALGTSSMLKSESDEIHGMLDTACSYLDSDRELRKIFPLAIEYKVGVEAQLIQILAELIDILKAETSKNIEEVAQRIEEKKQKALHKGQEQLDKGDYDSAKKTFSGITEEYLDDDELAADVGDRFLRAGLYEDASVYLETSAKLNAQNAHVFNRLGIALRKIKRFEVAEENFRKALILEQSDPNLHFNLGRLYLDWQKWDLAEEQGEAARRLDPDFVQAGQMITYARRMQEKDSE